RDIEHPDAMKIRGGDSPHRVPAAIRGVAEDSQPVQVLAVARLECRVARLLSPLCLLLVIADPLIIVDELCVHEVSRVYATAYHRVHAPPQLQQAAFKGFADESA